MRCQANKLFPLIFVASVGLSFPASAFALSLSSGASQQSGSDVRVARLSMDRTSLSTRPIKDNGTQASYRGRSGLTRLPPKAVKVVQRALNHHGAKLKPNGRMGLKTAEALINFQETHSLVPTGYMNAKTARKLGILAVLKSDGVSFPGSKPSQSALV